MFLPDDYEAPKSSSQGYMKLQDGENRFRILSRPLIGWEDWTLEKKPIRFKYNNKPAKPIDPKKAIKHFWTMIVYNYNEEKIQILHITQVSIRKALEKLCRDADWGAPFFYDIKIVKEGQNVDTEYSVNPISPKPVSAHIIEQFKENPCYLEALFDNADPFDSKWGEFTPGVFEKADVKDEFKAAGISKEKAEELTRIIDRCDDKYRISVWEALQAQKISNLTQLSFEMYERLLKAATKKMNEKEAMDLPF